MRTRAPRAGQWPDPHLPSPMCSPNLTASLTGYLLCTRHVASSFYPFHFFLGFCDLPPCTEETCLPKPAPSPLWASALPAHLLGLDHSQSPFLAPGFCRWLVGGRCAGVRGLFAPGVLVTGDKLV